MLSYELTNALYNPGNAKITPGTARMLTTLRLLDNPEAKYKVIHIAGTNGKGSTAAFIEAGLVHAGHSVGKFSSPHIRTINECICLNHLPIADEDLGLHFRQIQDILKPHKIELSPFELLTVIMFNHFAHKGIDYLVLEVGMGGADDATNVVDSIVSIITNISLEHTKFLGDTLADSARAKSGIIQNGLTIIADTISELKDAVSAKTANYTNVLDYYQFTSELDYQTFSTTLTITHPQEDKAIYNLSLFGYFQIYNFLCAHHTFKYLQIPIASIKYAAENTYNQGRFEIREKNPLLIFDATHNLSGAINLVKTIQGRFNLEEVVIVTSIMSDKDQVPMLTEFAKIASTIICTTISDNQRATKAHDLMALARQVELKHTEAIEDPVQALAIARGMKKQLILVTGSLYLLGYFY